MAKFLKHGFTLTEIIMVMCIVGLLSGVIVINLFRSKNYIALDSTINVLINDIKNQQLKTMVGATEGRINHDAYGIYFEQNKYTLFHGTTYQSSDPTNFSINLDNGVVFSQINLSNSQIIFSAINGEIQSFNPTQNTLTLKNNYSKETKTLTINNYGVIISVN